MSLPLDLLQQARQLSLQEPRRPKQASLRRAISAAYYALFHLLTEEAARLLISGPDRVILRQCLRRTFSHTAMKLASAEFVRGRPNARFLPALAGSPVPAALSAVALAFVELQQARHEADYDHLRVYTRPNARDIVQRTEQAFHLWRTVKGTPAADIYLVALLAQGNLRG